MAEAKRSAPVRSGGLAGVPLFLAGLALALWAAFAITMLVFAHSADEVFWTRLAFVFASVEAVAFGAAGAMWGVTIQKDRAETAERVAAANVEDAANGRALAATTIADAADIVADDGTVRLERLGPTGDTAGDGVLRKHAQIARMLFPDI
jgi:hypothetical protein